MLVYCHLDRYGKFHENENKTIFIQENKFENVIDE